METFKIPSEAEFKQWIKEAVRECFAEFQMQAARMKSGDEPLLTKDEIAELFDISLTTVTTWVKEGMPSLKQKGRIYFLKSDVLLYLKQNNTGPFKPSKQFSESTRRFREELNT